MERVKTESFQSQANLPGDNRNVIQPAMKEVNKLSNIHIEMETRMKGRSVTGIRFIVKPNAQLSLVGMDTEDEISNRHTYKALLAEGISKTLARAWVIEYDEEYIFEKLDLASSQSATGKIKSSKAGFLKSAIEQDYHNEGVAKKKSIEAAHAVKVEREKQERQLEALSKSHKEAQAAYRRFCAGTIQGAFDALSSREKESVTSEFQSGLGSRIYVDAFKKNGWKDILSAPDIRAFWETRGMVFPSPAEWAQESEMVEPDILRAQMDALKLQMS
ncbi:replication initiation protein [Halocynthiibacter namhaensis]|uniref:replication initiation protein n=1 Tax=Halocynthiibacter namhaensis TaxID=1290553 RepID=UPI001EE24203|nr:replication initiation protein [Halocynthiibacter namhaensis]